MDTNESTYEGNTPLRANVDDNNEVNSSIIWLWKHALQQFLNKPKDKLKKETNLNFQVDPVRLWV